MAKRKSENKVDIIEPVIEIPNEDGLIIPAGVEVVADLGNGIVVAKVDVALIREQDKNARVMKPEMARQLMENIKKRGGLESLPFCVLTDKIEVISGHHRLTAAKEAGLKFIYVLLDVSGLNRSQIAAKQIAHNSLNGFDDQSMLKEIARLITDVDDMIESYIGKDILGEPMAEMEKLLSTIVDYDWKEIQFVFLPHQVKKIEQLVELCANKKEYMGVAHIDQYEKLIDTLQKYQSFSNVKNIGAAVYYMIEHATTQMEDAGFNGEEQWVTLTSLFGSGAVPIETSQIVREAIDKMKKEGIITDKEKRNALEIMAANYLLQSNPKS
jgi:hypothetical protein